MPGGRRPRPPGYQPKKYGEFVAVFTNQQVKVIDKSLKFPELRVKKPIFKSQEEKIIWDKYQAKGFESLIEGQKYIFDTIEYEERGKTTKTPSGHLHYFENILKIQKIRVKPEWEKFTEIRIVPRQSHYILEIVYEKNEKDSPELDKNKALGVDIGIYYTKEIKETKEIDLNVFVYCSL